MTNRLHRLTRLAACGLLLLGATGVEAQQPRTTFAAPPQGSATPGAQAGVPRPGADPLRMKKLDPELESILAAWEDESSKIEVLQGTHYRQEFNNVFSVEKRAKGMFYFHAPDRGRFDMQAVEIAEGQKSNEIDPNTQKPYQLASSAEQGWVCTGKEILIINPVAREFEVYPIPADMQGERISQSPLPFLFGMKAEEAKRRFDLKLIGQNADAYYIDAVPLQQMDSQNYKHARIILSKKNFIPMTVYLLDPAGSIMTKYRFVDVKVNPGRNVLAGILGPLFKDADPFKPDLSGYKFVQQPAIQPVSNSAPGQERSNAQRPTAPNGFPQQQSRVPRPR